ncbi:MAG: hypothetical protein ALECFALPRED_006136 [Alectoria fallacina]|uniref:Elongator complex protein 5 n=1 Tax=Alectoria fallacina TaxID=1903189 RepID=A0A8H3I9H2_9LECA|nr:MAG: hypothetical protein ALECFALPRED_006136 [Alectoria fallacina]
MSARALHHRRQHHILLLHKLLSSRDASSPFTLLLDSVEQSAKPLIRHFIQGAKASKTDVVFVAWETMTPPTGVTAFVKARRKEPAAVQEEIRRNLSASKRTLLILDTLYPLATHPPTHLPSFLSSLTSPTASLLAIYHTDIPLPAPSPSHPNTLYNPSPLPLLSYLATALLTPHSPSQVLARHRAAARSLPEPVFGLAEERDGVVVGVGANDDGKGVVLKMEYRRKSGRGVEEWFFLEKGGGVGLLVDREGWKGREEGEEGEGGEGDGGTFELGLTDKQRRDREGVVLPYFDAQKGEGGGGGRILYDMGVEDDFDEEEDEI